MNKDGFPGTALYFFILLNQDFRVVFKKQTMLHCDSDISYHAMFIAIFQKDFDMQSFNIKQRQFKRLKDKRQNLQTTNSNRNDAGRLARYAITLWLQQT